MSGAKDQPGVRFIVTTDAGKTDMNTRKLIRSHVMRGKNLGRSLPPRKKKRELNLHTESDEEAAMESEVIRYAASTIPERVGSDISFLDFPDSIHPKIVKEVMNFSQRSKKVLFPLEPCIALDRENRAWWNAMTVDSAYLNTVAFIAHAYVNVLCGVQDKAITHSALSHFLRTVHLLRERISGDQSLVKADSTLFIILALVMYANITGDIETAKHHMKGLYRVFLLRGGENTFHHNPKLLMELIRADIAVVLQSGSKALFSNETMILNQKMPVLMQAPRIIFDESPNIKDSPDDTDKFLSFIDSNLAEAWNFMEDFSSLMNVIAKEKQKIPQENLMSSMTWSMYRLLSLNFKPNTVNEALRLGLLAYCSQTFLRWKNIRTQLPSLLTAYKNSLLSLKVSDELPCQIVLWLLMVGAISVFGPSDDSWLNPWLKVNFEICRVESWADLKRTMHHMMWIEIVHDTDGKKVYENCRCQS